MSWQTQLRGDPLPWLLDAIAPGVRYLALRGVGQRMASDDRWQMHARLRALIVYLSLIHISEPTRPY